MAFQYRPLLKDSPYQRYKIHLVFIIIHVGPGRKDTCNILKFARFSVYCHNSLQFVVGESIIPDYPRLKMSVGNHHFLQPAEICDVLPDVIFLKLELL